MLAQENTCGHTCAKFIDSDVTIAYIITGGWIVALDDSGARFVVVAEDGDVALRDTVSVMNDGFADSR